MTRLLSSFRLPPLLLSHRYLRWFGDGLEQPSQRRKSRANKSLSRTCEGCDASRASRHVHMGVSQAGDVPVLSSATRKVPYAYARLNLRNRRKLSLLSAFYRRKCKCEGLNKPSKKYRNPLLLFFLGLFCLPISGQPDLIETTDEMLPIAYGNFP